MLHQGLKDSRIIFTDLFHNKRDETVIHEDSAVDGDYTTNVGVIDVDDF